jgi:hypothetical protein
LNTPPLLVFVPVNSDFMTTQKHKSAIGPLRGHWASKKNYPHLKNNHGHPKNIIPISKTTLGIQKYYPHIKNNPGHPKNNPGHQKKQIPVSRTTMGIQEKSPISQKTRHQKNILPSQKRPCAFKKNFSCPQKDPRASKTEWGAFWMPRVVFGTGDVFFWMPMVVFGTGDELFGCPLSFLELELWGISGPRPTP